MKKQIGIWLDFKEAFVIEINGASPKVTRINSNIEFTHPGGGARSKIPWGPMDKISESKLLDRRTQQSAAYYSRILDEMNQGDEVFVFGPAQAKLGLLKKIETIKNNKFNFRGIVSADAMTENQKIAFVRDFFKTSN